MSEQYKLKQSDVDPSFCLDLFDLDNTLPTGAKDVLWGRFSIAQGISRDAFAGWHAVIHHFHDAALAALVVSLIFFIHAGWPRRW